MYVVVLSYTKYIGDILEKLSLNLKKFFCPNIYTHSDEKAERGALVASGAEGKSVFAAEEGAQPLEELKARLSGLAADIVAQVTKSAPADSLELLSGFVTELFKEAAQQSIREDRRKKQAEGIARAKAKGVRFGPKLKPLPENFEDARRCWRDRKVNLKEAARLCGMPVTTFYDAVRRVEQPAKECEH